MDIQQQDIIQQFEQWKYSINQLNTDINEQLITNDKIAKDPF